MIIPFTKVELPWGFLGNMAPYPITFEGQRWGTSEALFQALRFENPEIRELIRNEPSPMGAKMKAKKKEYRKYQIIQPMSEQDLLNMRMVLKLKFDTHLDIRKKLIQSAPHTLVEDIGERNGARHLFWGMRRVGQNWEGNNMMGKLLIELRDQYIRDATT